MQEYRPDSGVGQALFEEFDLLAGHGFKGPGLGRRAEDLDGLAADLFSSRDRIADASGRGNMGPDLRVLHQVKLMIPMPRQPHNRAWEGGFGVIDYTLGRHWRYTLPGI